MPSAPRFEKEDVHKYSIPYLIPYYTLQNEHQTITLQKIVPQKTNQAR